jgi:polygalacturonase
MKYIFCSIVLLAVVIAGCKTESSAQHTIYNVRGYGATGNGIDKDTVAFQAAFDACAAKGGGEIIVPPGNYLIGSVQMHAHTTLKFEQGSVLIGSDDTNDYPSIAVRWEGRWEMGRCSLIYATNADDIAIVGPGQIEGNVKMAAPQNPRGALVIESVDCNNVLWDGFTVTQGGNWATHPVYCTNVVIRNVTITGRRDGIDIDSCKDVLIDGCNVETGDDSISLKSGRGAQAVAIGRPTENVVITNCTLVDHRFADVGIGSETSGGIYNVRIVDCRLTAPRSSGIFIKTRIGRGGAITNIFCDDLDVIGGGFLRIDLTRTGNSNTADDPVPGLVGYPLGENFSFTNVRMTNATVMAEISRISSEKPLDGLVISNVTGTCARAMTIDNTTNVLLSDIHVSGYKGRLLNYTNVEGSGLDLE